MINVMNPSKETIKQVESYLDPQLWHACAGGMVQMPAVNSKVFYFPQGHLEHAQIKTQVKNYPKLPSLLPCKVSTIKYLADQGTDEVYAKITLLPLTGHETNFSDSSGNDIDGADKPASFAKTLTQSDANNGGGFSVPRYCAETIFPRLDYSAEPPVQTILAKDVHGVTWKFRHIYRGTPRRHLLTTGWSNFVSQKKLVAGDSIVFLRAENGDLCVGIRRQKNGIGGGGPECGGPSRWNSNSGDGGGGGCYGLPYGFYLRDGSESRMMGRDVSGAGLSSSSGVKVRVEDVIESGNRAANGEAFEVVYYPRSSTPEFFVKASAVKASLQVQWCPGMRFKMAFETEDSSRISWFMGTVSSAQVADPIYWPNSPWRLLQVAWDEPELLQNVKRVNPWLVELVASMPTMHHMSPFSPPTKKLRYSHQPLDFPFPSNTTLSPCNNPLFAGIQEARRSHFRHFMSDLHSNKVNHPNNPFNNNSLSTFLTMATSEDKCLKKIETKVPFMLFGKPILTEQQISESSGDSSGTLDTSSEGSGYPSQDNHLLGIKLGLGMGPTIAEQENVGYEDLYKKIAQQVWQDKVREAHQFIAL